MSQEAIDHPSMTVTDITQSSVFNKIYYVSRQSFALFPHLQHVVPTITTRRSIHVYRRTHI